MLAGTADALSVRITDVASGASVVIVDGVDDAAADGVIAVIGTVLGNSSVDLTSALIVDENGKSTLTTNVGNAVAGSDGLIVEATHAGFRSAASAPQPSMVSFTLNGSNVNSTVTGMAGADDGNAEFSFASASLSGSVSTTGENATDSTAVALSDPFSLTGKYVIQAGGAVTFDSTIIAMAAIPLPAAGLLLLGGLGGLVMVRRRRKAA